MPANHELFLERLDASQTAVWWVAHYLWQRGHTVKLPPYERAPTYEERGGYSDNGDLYVDAGDDAGWHRCEVKRLGYPFTCRKDWPHKTYMVCSTSSFDRATEKPDWYFHLNPDMTHFGFVDVGKTVDQWQKQTAKDSNFGGLEQEVYVVNPDRVRFMELRFDNG
ncbi:MAG: hypothetical protein AMJ84_00320 [Acidithiobacillales bacterium SM23_46]|nr:MAG: hypothetical protein AMJ84_00320 [Acidithiobacillales bacterium SM23_46]KPL29001.1 MAG: hypothetical protein AMJ72_00130 [Acidithiobacillales bacterium SM1_46]